jgi:hypothetical protein
MSNEKLIIEKLVKIATNQQKIINKLAQQQAGWHDVTKSVAAILSSLPSGKNARVQSAVAGSSGVHVKLQVKDLSSTADDDLRTALADQHLQTADGQTVQAPDASQINVISQMG